MSASGILSLACLVITGALASWAVLSRHFDDTLLQRIGLSTIATACILRIPGKLANPDTPAEVLLAQVGLCLFGIGTAWRIWQQHKRHHERRPERRGMRRGAGT
jgi:hypothetical protein